MSKESILLHCAVTLTGSRVEAEIPNLQAAAGIS